MAGETGSRGRSRRRPGPTVRSLARSYSPRRLLDLLFLHSLALSAARRSLRDVEPPLYVPREWEYGEPGDTSLDADDDA